MQRAMTPEDRWNLARAAAATPEERAHLVALSVESAADPLTAAVRLSLAARACASAADPTTSALQQHLLSGFDPAEDPALLDRDHLLRHCARLAALRLLRPEDPQVAEGWDLLRMTLTTCAEDFAFASLAAELLLDRLEPDRQHPLWEALTWLAVCDLEAELPVHLLARYNAAGPRAPRSPAAGLRRRALLAAAMALALVLPGLWFFGRPAPEGPVRKGPAVLGAAPSQATLRGDGPSVVARPGQGLPARLPPGERLQLDLKAAEGHTAVAYWVTDTGILSLDGRPGAVSRADEPISFPARSGAIALVLLVSAEPRTEAQWQGAAELFRDGRWAEPGMDAALRGLDTLVWERR